jgi:hypothetical protein
MRSFNFWQFYTNLFKLIRDFYTRVYFVYVALLAIHFIVLIVYAVVYYPIFLILLITWVFLFYILFSSYPGYVATALYVRFLYDVIVLIPRLVYVLIYSTSLNSVLENFLFLELLFLFLPLAGVTLIWKLVAENVFGVFPLTAHAAGGHRLVTSSVKALTFPKAALLISDTNLPAYFKKTILETAKVLDNITSNDLRRIRNSISNFDKFASLNKLTANSYGYNSVQTTFEIITKIVDLVPSSDKGNFFRKPFSYFLDQQLKVWTNMADLKKLWVDLGNNQNNLEAWLCYINSCDSIITAMSDNGHKQYTRYKLSLYQFFELAFEPSSADLTLRVSRFNEVQVSSTIAAVLEQNYNCVITSITRPNLQGKGDFVFGVYFPQNRVNTFVHIEVKTSWSKGSIGSIIDDVDEKLCSKPKSGKTFCNFDFHEVMNLASNPVKYKDAQISKPILAIFLAGDLNFREKIEASIDAKGKALIIFSDSYSTKRGEILSLKYNNK